MGKTGMASCKECCFLVVWINTTLAQYSSLLRLPSPFIFSLLFVVFCVNYTNSTPKYPTLVSNYVRKPLSGRDNSFRYFSLFLRERKNDCVTVGCLVCLQRFFYLSSLLIFCLKGKVEIAVL